MFRKIASLIAVSAALSFFQSSALAVEPLAQAGPARLGEVSGSVKDALGRPIAGAAIALRARSGAIAARSTSDAQGAFSFQGVAPGTYAVVAEKAQFQTGTAIVTVSAGAAATTAMTLAAQDTLDISVSTQRLDQARNGLSPKTGTSQYSFNESDIEALPRGENTTFNEVLLQAPGVANDSFGQLHVRGDHANLQYRINGVILPEGITGFGQALDTRFASRIDLLTGALPAQYGYRTAGIVDIQTKTGYETGGSAGVYGGSHGTVNPSVQAGGGKDDLSYYVTGSFMQNDLGIENPVGTTNAIHDQTKQTQAFGYLSKLVDSTSRLSAMFGSYDGKFQIPNNPGQTPDPDGLGFLAGAGVANFDSASLNETQRELNRYGVLAYQSTLGSSFDYQVALFTRYTSVRFNPDPLGDLVFNGVSSLVFRSSQSSGVQGDGSMKLNDSHTLRTGFFYSSEKIQSDNSSTVFPVNNAGDVTGPAFTVVDNNPKGGNHLYGLYVQDEWQPTGRLTVNYGLRADYMSSFVSGGQLSPRLGTVYKLSPDTTLHAGYSRYFTPPPTELVSPQTVALFQGTSNQAPGTGNSNVLPERSSYFDVGATHRLTPELNLGIDGYYRKVRDLLDEGQFGQALVYTPFNYDRAEIYGVELTANYKKDDFTAYANMAKAYAKATNIVSSQYNFASAELAYIASNYVYVDHDQRYTGSAGASYRWQGTLYSASAIYGSGLRAGFANTGKLPPYTRVDFGAERDFDTTILGKLQGRVAVINVFDKVYEIRDGTGIGVGAPQFGPRRAFYAGLAKIF